MADPEDSGVTVCVKIAGVGIRLVLRGLGHSALDHLVSRKLGPFARDGEGDPVMELAAECRSGWGPFAGHEPVVERNGDGVLLGFRHRTSSLRKVDGCGGSAEQWRLEFGFDDPRPVENALRVLVSERLRQDGGGVFHAAGIVACGGALLFPGISGAGKTTLSLKAGRELVLSDEMPAVVGTKAGLRAAATPFFGDMGHGERSDDLPLKAIVLLAGKDTEFCRPAGEAEARQALLSTYVLYGPGGAASAQAEAAVAGISERVTVLALGSRREEPFPGILARIESALGGTA